MRGVAGVLAVVSGARLRRWLEGSAADGSDIGTADTARDGGSDEPVDGRGTVGVEGALGGGCPAAADGASAGALCDDEPDA